MEQEKRAAATTPFFAQAPIYSTKFESLQPVISPIAQPVYLQDL